MPRPSNSSSNLNSQRLTSKFSVISWARHSWSYNREEDYGAKSISGNIENLFAFDTIPQHQIGTGSWNPSSWKTETYLSGCGWPWDSRSSRIWAAFFDPVTCICKYSGLSTRRYNLLYHPFVNFLSVSVSLQTLFTYQIIQSSAVITWSDITWYWIPHSSVWGRTKIRACPHKRHPIPRSHRRATGCLLWGISGKLTPL